MKTLADFKRALQVGSKWECMHVPTGTNLGFREVAKTKSNGVGFGMPDGRVSWLYFPKASEIEFDEYGYVRIYALDSYYLGNEEKEERVLLLIYRKV